MGRLCTGGSSEIGPIGRVSDDRELYSHPTFLFYNWLSTIVALFLYCKADHKDFMNNNTFRMNFLNIKRAPEFTSGF